MVDQKLVKQSTLLFMKAEQVKNERRNSQKMSNISYKLNMMEKKAISDAVIKW